MSELGKRFKAIIDKPENVLFSDEINGFGFPPIPVIANENEDVIATDFYWGLIPAWCKDDSMRKNTLNAKIETIHEKPSFRDVVNNRCLVIATGFYDWRWLDEKGKSKQKYEIRSSENEILTFAGIYSKWKNPENDEIVKTFAVVTTQANKQMSYIHNVKLRMPIVLQQKDEMTWLDSKNEVEDFMYPKYDSNLIAFAV